MFNQFKLLLILILLGILGVLFFQNQEPISLKLLCGDTASQYCWYQSPTQPLAVWMVLFLVLGVISSLIWQLLQNLGSPRFSPIMGDNPTSSPRPESNYQTKVNSSSATETSRSVKNSTSTSTSDWEYSGQREDWEDENISSQNDNPTINRDNTVRDSDFEVKQEPQNISQSGSTYSYQFKESRKSVDQVMPHQKRDRTSKNTDEVYDANYRTISTPKYGDVNKNTDTDEDDEDWV